LELDYPFEEGLSVKEEPDCRGDFVVGRGMLNDKR